ncbi:hypothetical protein AAMO2058_001260600 [Amorphochlora amoebiformis]
MQLAGYRGERQEEINERRGGAIGGARDGTYQRRGSEGEVDAKGIKVSGGTLKRKGDFLGDGKEYLEFTPLGAGQEVGRSCHILSYKGVNIMLDCGVHPGYSGMNSLPFFDVADIKSIDLLLVSHFHLDHAAALPYFLQKTPFRGRTFMTHPTKAIYRLLVQDFIKVSSISTEDMLFNDKDLSDSMAKIEDINFHQTVTHKGIKFWCLHAGHVLGAAMFVIEIADIRILYTGDYSRTEDRHLKAAEIPERKPDVLIVEATFGIRSLSPIRDRERRFTGNVEKILKRGGRVLIPVFALGRAQELLLILEEHWNRNKWLHQFPIFYASSLGKKSIEVFKTFTNMMNTRIQHANQMTGASPFGFRFIEHLKGRDHFRDEGPCVVLATPGMLQNGFSRELLEKWCPSHLNGLIIAGYTVQSTLAHEILREPETIESMSGQTLEFNMSLLNVSFTAHADFNQTAEFIDYLEPTLKDVIFVHGETTNMTRLRDALMQREEEKQDKKSNLRYSTPKNSQTVRIEVSSRKVAKIVKTLANQEPQDGDIVSGLVIEKDFKYTVIDPVDLTEESNLSSWTVEQSLSVHFPLSDSHLVYILGRVFDVSPLTAKNSDANPNPNPNPDPNAAGTGVGQGGDEKVVVGDEMELEEGEGKVRSNGKETKTSREPAEETRSWLVHGAVQVSRPEDKNTKDSLVLLAWDSNPANDVIADSIVSLLMSSTTSPGAALQFTNHQCSLKPLSALNDSTRSVLISRQREEIIQEEKTAANAASKEAKAIENKPEGLEISEEVQATLTAVAKGEQISGTEAAIDRIEDLVGFLRLHYPDVKQTKDGYIVELNGHVATIEKISGDLRIRCDDETVRDSVGRVVKYAELALGKCPRSGLETTL